MSINLVNNSVQNLIFSYQFSSTYLGGLVALKIFRDVQPHIEFYFHRSSYYQLCKRFHFHFWAPLLLVGSLSFVAKVAFRVNFTALLFLGFTQLVLSKFEKRPLQPMLEIVRGETQQNMKQVQLLLKKAKEAT